MPTMTKPQIAITSTVIIVELTIFIVFAIILVYTFTLLQIVNILQSNILYHFDDDFVVHILSDSSFELLSGKIIEKFKDISYPKCGEKNCNNSR